MSQPSLSEVFSLKGEIVLITGGGTGLGLAMAKCFVSAGAQVVITGRREDVLKAAVQDIGGSAQSITCDVSRLENLPELIRDVESRIGPLSVLVNNAGIHLKKPALETTDAEFSNVIQTHLAGSFALAREAAKVMLPRKKGNIILIGSMASLFGIPNVLAYTAAKTAVVGMCRALATEWSSEGIRVNAIAPGWIGAGMGQSALDKDPERKAKIISRTPMHRLGESQDIGWAAVYLSSVAAKFVTGHTLVVDGGASIGF